MNDDDLDSVNLHAWRVPPGSVDRADIIARALAPVAARRRSRGTWAIAGFAVANVVLAAILFIVVSRQPAPAVTARPAGGGNLDAQTQKLLLRLTQEQLELEQKVAEIKQLRETVEQLAQKVRDCDQTVKHDHAPAPAPEPSCDEVSCVLNDYEGACCAKYRKPPPPPPPPASTPESLDREAISSGMASVRAKVAACASTAPAKGTVKIHVRVAASGLVTNVEVVATPDPALGGCVARAVARAVFPRTLTGGAFSYPFVF
jgi:outer membrane biosynthesis protein TonB